MRLQRDVSIDSSKERSFKKSLRNKRTKRTLEKYLKKRGKRGYTKKSFKKFLRNERMKDFGGAMGKVGEKKVMEYLNQYGKMPSSSGISAPTSNSGGGMSVHSSEKLQQAAKQRAKRRASQQKREIREQFGPSLGKFGGEVRPAREGINLDPRAGVQGPRSGLGARSAPDFGRASRTLRPRG